MEETIDQFSYCVIPSTFRWHGPTSIWKLFKMKNSQENACHDQIISIAESVHEILDDWSRAIGPKSTCSTQQLILQYYLWLELHPQHSSWSLVQLHLDIIDVQNLLGSCCFLHGPSKLKFDYVICKIAKPVMSASKFAQIYTKIHTGSKLSKRLWSGETHF